MTSPRILTAIAVVSVILNLILVGFFVGQRLPHFAAHWRGGPHMEREFTRDLPPPGPPGELAPGEPGQRREIRARIQVRNDELNFSAAMRTLDPELRKSVQDKFRSNMPEIRKRLEDVVNKRTALLEVLAAEPADMARVSQALEDVRSALTAVQEHSHKLFMEIAGDLPAEARAVFMKAAATQRQPRPRNPEPRNSDDAPHPPEPRP